MVCAHVLMFFIILLLGANTHTRDRKQSTPYDEAIRLHYPEISQYLYEEMRKSPSSLSSLPPKSSNEQVEASALTCLNTLSTSPAEATFEEILSTFHMKMDQQERITSTSLPDDTVSDNYRSETPLQIAKRRLEELMRKAQADTVNKKSS